MISNEFFEKLGDALKSDGINVYYKDLPDESSTFPFVNFHTTDERDTRLKSGSDIGYFTLTYYVWNNRLDKRSEVASLCNKVFSIAKSIMLDDASLIIRINRKNISIDTSTNTPYLVGEIELNINYSK